jgi:site-specific DNA-cytosine methylase
MPEEQEDDALVATPSDVANGMPQQSIDDAILLLRPTPYLNPKLPWVMQSVEIYREIWLSTPMHRRTNLLSLWRKRKGRPVRVSTLCSGTDAPIKALLDLQTIFNDELSGTDHLAFFKHIMACDSKAIARRFIDANFSVANIFHETPDGNDFTNQNEISSCGPPIFSTIRRRTQNGPSVLIANRIREVAHMDRATEGAIGMPRMREVPRSNDILWSSFSCKPHSIENTQRKGNGNSLEDGDDESGVTFEGMVDFLAAGSTKLGVSENVTGLVKTISTAGSDEDFVPSDSDSAVEVFDGASRHIANAPPLSDLRSDVEETTTLRMSARRDGTGQDVPANLSTNMLEVYTRLHDSGCVVLHMVLDNIWFLLPQKRSRVWILFACPKNLHIGFHDALQRLENSRRDILELVDVLKEKTLPIDSCNFASEGHPRLLEQMDRMAERVAKWNAKNAIFASKKCKLRPSWYNSMREAYRVAEVEWIEPVPGSHLKNHIGTQDLDPFAERSNVWYASLPTREKFVLRLITGKFPRVGGEKRAFVLSRGEKRAAFDRPIANRLPCTMPRTKVWLEFLARPQTGDEKLMSQGFFDGEYTDARISNAGLADLAGNAVGVPIAAAINQCLLENFLDVLNLSIHN